MLPSCALIVVVPQPTAVARPVEVAWWRRLNCWTTKLPLKEVPEAGYGSSFPLPETRALSDRGHAGVLRRNSDGNEVLVAATDTTNKVESPRQKAKLLVP